MKTSFECPHPILTSPAFVSGWTGNLFQLQLLTLFPFHLLSRRNSLPLSKSVSHIRSWSFFKLMTLFNWFLVPFCRWHCSANCLQRNLFTKKGETLPEHYHEMGLHCSTKNTVPRGTHQTASCRSTTPLHTWPFCRAKHFLSQRTLFKAHSPPPTNNTLIFCFQQTK